MSTEQLSGTTTNNFVVERYRYGMKIDKLMIEKYPKLFKRINNELLIHLENEKILTYKDDEDGYWLRYTIIDYFQDIEYVLLRWHEFVHNGAYILINRINSKSLDGLCGIPLFSPDRKRVISFSIKDVPFGYFDNCIHIVNLSNLEYEFTFESQYNKLSEISGPTEVKWIDSKTIKVFLLYNDGTKENRILKYMHGKWLFKQN